MLEKSALLNYLKNREDLLKFINKFVNQQDFKITYNQDKILKLFQKVEKTLKRIKFIDTKSSSEDNSYSTVLKFLNKLIKPLRKKFITKNQFEFNFSSFEEIDLPTDLSLKIDAILEILHNSKIFPDTAKNIVLISVINLLQSKNLTEQDFHLKELILENETKSTDIKSIDIELKQKFENKRKFLGQVFTPIPCVNKMLDEVDFKGLNIVEKYVLEPSFGDGNFLSVIVERYIKACEIKEYSKKQIEKSLNKYIYGVELDSSVYEITKIRLNSILKEYELKPINWDNLYNINTMDFNPKIKFNFILGNPPYVSSKNLDNKSKEIIESYPMLTRASDLYVYFYVKCNELLAKNGKLIFITPNRFLKLPSLSKFRNWLKEENLIKKIENFQDFQIFPDATVNTAILYLEKNKADSKFTYIDKNTTRIIDCRDLGTNRWILTSDIDSSFISSLGNKPFKIEQLKNIKGLCSIQTALNNFFIGDIIEYKGNGVVIFKNDFGEFEIEENILSKTFKSSKLQYKEDRRLIFPFNFENNKYSAITEKELANKFPKAYKMFLFCKKDLIKRKVNSSWFSYSSKNINNDFKLAFKHNMNFKKGFECEIITDSSIKVYGGFHFASNDLTKLERLKQIFESEDFYKYSKIVGKDLSSTFNTLLLRDIKSYKVDFQLD